VFQPKNNNFRKATSAIVLIAFLCSGFTAPAGAELLPSAGISVGFQPPVLLGLKIHPENPLLLDFIVDKGAANLSEEQLKAETEKLVKYFLAALTIPDKEVWVNLSPYEKDRIVPDVLGQTAMGKTMLEQDYLLKQFASGLTNPDEKIGQDYWDKVKSQVKVQLGSADVPMNTFNKVWIVPAKAEVLESQGIVLVGQKHLKVMMDEDYLALSKNVQDKSDKAKDVNMMSSAIFKDTILPKIEQEVNEGKNFADVRQIYNSVILAAWYKQALKESLLGKVYADKSKVLGVETDDKAMKERIYEQYLTAFKKGAYNLIKEEADTVTGEMIPRKYFSGGLIFSASSALSVQAVAPDVINSALSASSAVFAEVGLTEADPFAGLINSEGAFNPLGQPIVRDRRKEADVAVKRTAREIFKLGIPGVLRLSDYMTLYQYAANFKGEARDQRFDELAEMLLNDPMLRMPVFNIEQEFMRNNKKDEYSVEELDEHILNILQQAHALLEMAWKGPLAKLREKSDLLYEIKQNPPTGFEDSPGNKIGLGAKEFEKRKVVERILKRLLTGQADTAGYLVVPTALQEAINLMIDQRLWSDAGAGIAEEEDREWLVYFKVHQERALAIDQSQYLEGKEIQRVDDKVYGMTLASAYLRELLLTKYYSMFDVFFEGMGISVNKSAQPVGEEKEGVVDKELLPILELSQRFIDVVNEEVNLEFGKKKSDVDTLFAGEESQEGTAKDEIDALPRDETQLSVFLNESTPELLDGLVKAIFRKPRFELAVTILQWRNYWRTQSLPPQKWNRENLINIIRDYVKYQANPSEEGRITMAMMQRLLQDVKYALIDLADSQKVDELRSVELAADTVERFVEGQNFLNAILSREFDQANQLTNDVIENQIVELRKLYEDFLSKEIEFESQRNQASSAVGGIDFNAANLNLQIKRDGDGVPLPLPQQNWEQINIEGFIPVIINMAPINAQNLPIFMGQK
jgi:hypothetical protein